MRYLLKQTLPFGFIGWYSSLTSVYFAGKTPGGEEISPYQIITPDMTSESQCEWTDPPTCLTINVDHLDWQLHGRHLYYISLKIEGINMLHRIVPSQPYEHMHGAPEGGMVIEVPLYLQQVYKNPLQLCTMIFFYKRYNTNRTFLCKKQYFTIYTCICHGTVDHYLFYFIKNDYNSL